MSQEPENLIAELKSSDRYFASIFDKYKALDLKIRLMDSQLESGSPDEIETLKAKKMALAEEINVLLECARSSRR